MKGTAGWPDSRLAEYYNALVKDGVNAERNFSTCAPGDPYDPLDYYQFGDADYLKIIQTRLEIIKKRDLTEIVILQPYRDSITDDQARWLIRALRPYLPNVILTPVNEPQPQDMDKIMSIVNIALNEGWPKRNLLIEYCDCGTWGDMMLGGLKNEVSVSRHWIGSIETINEIFSGGTAQEILSWGTFCGSNDGPDKLGQAHGLNFRYLEDLGVKNLRPTNDELHNIAGWFLSNGRGYEHLSAAAYQRPGKAFPNMDDAISLGRGERIALSSG
jgi:hypothetical protein